MAEPMLKLDGIHKRFGDLEVLRGIDLEVAKGEVVCVLGPSGSGKSTLLRCINLLEPPEEGDIFLEGEEVRNQFGTGRRSCRWCSSSSGCRSQYDTSFRAITLTSVGP